MQLNPTDHKQPIAARILRTPLIRLCVLCAILFYLYISGHLFRAQFSHNLWWLDLIVVLWMVALTLAIYIAFVRGIELRPASEVAVTGLSKELGLGLSLGAGLYTLCIGILMLLGVYHISGINSWQIPLSLLWFGLSSGFFEEMLFRGILFRISEELLGSWTAILISSLAFGLVHLNNPGASLQGVLFIATEAGLLLAAAYLLTGRLWLSMGFHMAWNFTQTAIFPVHITGNGGANALFKVQIAGPDLLTGGIFGMESSLVAFIVLTTLGMILLTMAVRRGNIKPPCWRRQD